MNSKDKRKKTKGSPIGTPDKSILESVSDSPLTTIAATALAVSSATAVASILPVLTGILAVSRYRKRIENWIVETNEGLEDVKDILIDISDSKFKFINETVVTAFSTIEEKKLAYLKNAVINCVSQESFPSHESILLSRVIRDISANEVQFIINTFDYKQIIVTTIIMDEKDALVVRPDSDDGLLVTGLINLGLLTAPVSGLGGTMNYSYSRITAKLISLLGDEK